MDKGFHCEVKTILKSLVVSSPTQVTVQQLNKDYRDIEGRSIPFQELGFKTLDSFLRSIPDTLQVTGGGPTAVVQFVPNEKSDHIHEMISKQKMSLPKSKTRNRNVRSTRNRPAIRMRRNFPSNWSYPNRFGTLQSTMTSSRCPQQPAEGYVSDDTDGMVSRMATSLLISDRVEETKASDLQDLYASLSTAKKNFANNFPNSPVHFKFFDELSSGKGNDNLVIPPNRLRHLNGSKIKKSQPENAQSQKNENEIKIVTQKNSHSNTERNNNTIAGKESFGRKLSKPKLSGMACDSVTSTVNRHHRTIEDFYAAVDSIRFDKPIKNDQNTNGFAEDAALSGSNQKAFDRVIYADKISSYQKMPHVAVGAELPIFITELISPLKFWFHVHKMNNEVDVLMDRLCAYFSSVGTEEFLIPKCYIVKGQICAAPYENNWYRAEVIAIPSGDMARVSLLDYGSIVDVPICDLKYLPIKFSGLPRQALRGVLAHINCIGLEWSPEAINHMVSMVRGLPLWAKVTAINKENRIAAMVLLDTNGGCTNITKELVRAGHAQYIKW